MEMAEKIIQQRAQIIKKEIEYLEKINEALIKRPLEKLERKQCKICGTHTSTFFVLPNPNETKEEIILCWWCYLKYRDLMLAKKLLGEQLYKTIMMNKIG